MSITVNDIADRVWARALEQSPLERLRVGLPVTHIPRGDRAEMLDEAEFARGVLADLDRVELSQAQTQDRLNAGCLRFSANMAVQAPVAFDHTFMVMPYTTYHLAHYGQNLFKSYDFSAEGNSADNYLSLVHDFVGIVSSIEERFRDQIARGILLPQPAIATAKGNIASIGAIANAYLVPIEDRAKGSGLDPAAVQAILDTKLAAHLASINELLEGEWVSRAPAEPGLCQQPDGLAAYEQQIEYFNTLQWKADEVHELGLEQVAMLAEQMAEIRGELGFTGTEAEFHASLRNEPELYVKTPEELLERYRGYMKRLDPHLSSFFAVLPKAPFDVQRLDESLEAGMTYGYYEQPTLERPVGLYRYNASSLESRSLLNAAAIIFHELAPGHHFHIARQMENESLHDFRRYGLAFGAFNEGWAEYASGLAREMGGYITPLERYGRLAHERFTAQRLVVDTGMNAKGWSLQRAREYMAANTFESELQISTETIRYSVDLPGQALGYRAGFLTFTGARERAEKALGASFDIKQFNEAALGSGALPLTVLEEHIAHELGVSN